MSKNVVTNSAALINISRSLDRIANALDAIRGAYLMEHRAWLKESRLRNSRAGGGVVGESVAPASIDHLPQKTPKELIRSIINGEYVQ